MHASVVGQLAALLVPGVGHSAEVMQDAAAAAMSPGHEGGGRGLAEQPSGLEILECWVGQGGTWPRSPADSPLLELSSNL